MDFLFIIGQVTIMLIVIFFLRKIYHFFLMAVSKKYRERINEEKQLSKEIKNKNEKMNEIESNSEFSNRIYDPYLNNFEILNYKQFELELSNFNCENNIVKIIYDSFFTGNLSSLDNSLVNIKKRDIKKESVLIYIKVIKGLYGKKLDGELDDIETTYCKVIQSRLLRIRRYSLSSNIQNSESKISQGLSQFRKENSLDKNNFSLDNITSKINNQDGYSSLLKKFLTDFKDLKMEVKNMIILEIIDNYIKHNK